MPAKRVQIRLWDLFAITTFVAVVVASATFLPSLYQTDGDIGAMLGVLVFMMFIFVVTILACYPRYRKTAILVGLLACALFMYRQTTLLHRLKQLEREVANVVNYVDGYKSAHGGCPSDLVGYNFRQPNLEPYITFFPPEPARLDGSSLGRRAYEIRFHPTMTDGIGHWYSDGRGYWFEDD